MIPDWLNIPAVLFGLGNAGFVTVLLLWHHGDNKFDFRETLIENGKISLSRLGQLTALVISTEVIVYQTIKGQLTEWLFTGYIVTWAGTYIANKFSPKDKADVPAA